MYTQEHQIRIRYAETDQMGFVYYGNYATFYEIGRVEALRQAGFPYRDLEAQGVMLPVLESTAKFLKPAHYDELITIKTTITQMPTVKMLFDHEIYNEQNELIHEAKIVLVFMKKDNHRPCRAPKALLDLLSPYFE